MPRKAYYVIAREFDYNGVRGKLLFTGENNEFISFRNKEAAAQYLQDHIPDEEVIRYGWKIVKRK